MQHPYKTWLSVGVALLLVVTGCRKTEGESKLHDRIVAANTSQYCHPPDACFNPSVLAVENGYDVTTFIGAKPQHAQVSVKELAKYLQGLPMQAWPRGPFVAISQTDVMTDERAVDQNFQAAQQLCRSLGLEVKVRPGG
jgi:hypothetical protein